eukprot:gnl/MRDRNA2_/MRDRNA2_28594_c0_seq1.p1 gnl/MRDRNA2_/MRDRNA2_28594_c0~~gnl/MRDRNA2_/MRDRNA2_28594_c0_seq1.p1  ORF type:complete len:484 (-),score=56.58 gnl/MRDRNA2_/MRDRNA2_28594_c0_seq1:365-1816(-)
MVKSNRPSGPAQSTRALGHVQRSGEVSDGDRNILRRKRMRKRQPMSNVNDISRRLARLEAQMVENCRRLQACDERSERDQVWQDIDELFRHDLHYACGYSRQTDTDRIISDFGCCRFERRDRWGKNRYEQNDTYSFGNHVYMVQDRVRVDAYTAVLDRKASGLRVLDVGAGPFCLLSRLALWAGAASVDCVEQSEEAVRKAIKLFLDEVESKECVEMCRTGTSFASLASLRVYVHCYEDMPSSSVPSLSLTCRTHDSYQKSSLRLFQGFSSDVPLPGGYDVVVHEILGHIASSEGVVDVIMNLRKRGLLSRKCMVIPRKAKTFFAPTEQISLTCLERILQMHHSGRSTVRPLAKYHVNRFPKELLLAAPACFEDLDLSGDLHARQHYVREFYTNRSAVFDGLHFHIFIDMDGISSINTLDDKTSWRTVYIRLWDSGMFLPAGSRIVCETWVELDCSEPRYFIEVAVGERRDERHVAKYSWSGC